MAEVGAPGEALLVLSGDPGGDVRVATARNHSLADFPVGSTVAVTVDRGWVGLRAETGRVLYLLTEERGVSLDGVLPSPTPLVSLALDEGCRGVDETGECGQPPGQTVAYDLTFSTWGSTSWTLRPGTWLFVSGVSVVHGGARLRPRYASAGCTVEAAARASVAISLAPPEDLCGRITRSYSGTLDRHASCGDDADCVVLNGPCGRGLGECYEAANADVQADLDRLGAAFANAGCAGPVCDCAEAPEAACLDGRCGFR